MSSENSAPEDEVSHYQTPIKSINRSLSTEERLTDNAVDNILPARYLLDNESPDDLFRRVADNVAQAEETTAKQKDWADEFYNKMSTLQLMPNSPTLMNAGADLQQLSACISGDTPIYTSDGLKQMRDIQEGDKVLTHTGSFETVTSHWSNGVKDTLDVKRGTSRGDNYSVTATPDHEFLTEQGDWKELRNVDSAAQPTASPDIEVPESFDLTKYTAVMGKDKPVVSDGGVLLVENSDDPRTAEYDQQYSEVVASVENTEQFGYLAGAYLAEGDVDGSDLRFTIGADEGGFEDRIVSALEQLFDVHVAVMESNHGNWKTITASSPFIADLFITQFGTGSTEKQVPDWVFATDEPYQQRVLDGVLDGDGHESENSWKLTLANPTLAYESSLLARNCGYDTNFTLDAENELSANPTSRVYISKEEGKTYMDTITTRSGGECEVFDMEVEGDHSFVAGDFVVHNCFVLEVGDSMAEPDEFGRESILDTVKHAGQIFKSGGGVGYTFSHLRQKGAHIESTDSETSGPLVFMRLFDEVCNTVKQGGKRRGAQMAIMRSDHPDIGRFAVCKREEGAFSNFNISVGVTDEFVEAVSDEEMYTLYDPQHDFDEPAEYLQETLHFYSPEYEDSPEAVVDENLWRDYADSIEAWDWDENETVSFREKWEGTFSTAVDSGWLSGSNEMRLPARFIWDLILDGAWRNGEPGLFYLDETNRKHSFDVDEHPEFKVHATNPCCAEGTLVNTPDGLRPVENIDEGDLISTVWGTELVDEVLSFENQNVYEVTFSDGGTQTVTEDHRYHAIKKGSHSKEVDDIPLRDLEEGDYVRLEPTDLAVEGSKVDYNHGLRRGILLGDGCITENIIQSKNIAKIASSEDDTEYNKKVKQLFGENNFNKDDNSHDSKSMNMIHTDGGSLVKELSLEPGKSHEKTFDVTEVNTRMEALGILDGLLATDGNINLWSNHPHVRWDTTSDELAQNIRRLLGLLGMHGRISTDDRNTGGEIDGRTIKKVHTCNEVAISGDSAKTYADMSLLEEIHPKKASQLKEMRQMWLTTGNTWKATIESIEEVGKETVYDLYASGSDTWITENYVQRGCAEQPLCDFEACNLAHVNLSLVMEKDAVTFDKWMDSQDVEYDRRESAIHEYLVENVNWEHLQEIVKTGTRLLDNVITMSDFPLSEITDTVQQMRKIGLGVMGWAQMLYQMGLRYGSHESLETARVVMNFIDKEATEYSHKLALERGSFGAWEDSKYANPTEYSEWFYERAHRRASNWEDGYEMRNHNVTTVAPTGTTSMIGNTTGGIEPAYNVAYKKNVGNDIQGAEKLVEFDDFFLQTLEYNNVDVEAVKEECATLMDENEFDSVQQLNSVPQEIADLFVTTNDISAVEHGMMQRAFQEKNDSGISKTINLPKQATHADVHNSYMLALADEDEKFGAPIKGLTVYRDQSRKTQVLTTQEYSDKEVDEAKEMLEELGYDVTEEGEQATENTEPIAVGGDD